MRATAYLTRIDREIVAEFDITGRWTPGTFDDPPSGPDVQFLEARFVSGGEPVALDDIERAQAERMALDSLAGEGCDYDDYAHGFDSWRDA